MKKSRKTYQELKLLRDTLRQEKSPFYKVEPREFESNDIMVHYVRPKSEPILDFLRFSFLLLSIPVILILMFCTLVLSIFVISIITIKDWFIQRLFKRS